MKHVKHSMEKRLQLYNFSFEELQVRYEHREEETFRSRVALILLDPPYNTRRARKKSNSDHDTLSEDDMVRVVNEIDDLLMTGGYALIFCSAIQFSK